MTAELLHWLEPPDKGFTYQQVKDLDLPYDWVLVDGVIVPRGLTNHWHDTVRDELHFALRNARVAPYGTNCERCVLVDELNVPKPDVVVFDRTGLDVRTLGCVPVASTVLAVEVVSVGSRSDDRFRKPGMYAAAGVDAYWRVERGTDDIPVVHEFRLDATTKAYVPAPVAEHSGILRTDFPYSVEIDLRAIVGDL